MLSKAIDFLESLPAVIVELKMMQREGKYVYTIFAKTEKGFIETFQLRGSFLYHFKRAIHGKPVTEELLYKFYEQK